MALVNRSMNSSTEDEFGDVGAGCGFGRGSTRQEVEDKIGYWRQEGESHYNQMKYHERKFKEACEEVAVSETEQLSMPLSVSDAKAELDKAVEKKVAEMQAKSAGEASQPPKTSAVNGCPLTGAKKAKAAIAVL
ncbi:hypothetical protein CDV31_001652 [Fusarium ambrosium]|uniref:Uncharacterized protein n=1 Tax=Fusarium ambrosium TaxID=131363 RepID=A0A428UZ00_9HYPO|nr:hypothetical protein CDV31_001652 [Fusarium ambrosium]